MTTSWTWPGLVSGYSGLVRDASYLLSTELMNPAELEAPLRESHCSVLLAELRDKSLSLDEIVDSSGLDRGSAEKAMTKLAARKWAKRWPPGKWGLTTRGMAVLLVRSD